MDNFREVSSCDKSTGLEYFFNNKYVKRDIKWKLAQKNVAQGFSFETQFNIEFITIVYQR